MSLFCQIVFENTFEDLFGIIMNKVHECINIIILGLKQQNWSQMNDLVIDKRIFLQIKKRNNGRAVLPEIKYPLTFTTNISHSQHGQQRRTQQMLYNKDLPFRIKPCFNDPPLSSILVSKRIDPSNPINSPLKQMQKKQNLNSIHKDSSIKIMEIEVTETKYCENRAASSSLSQRIHWKIQEKDVRKMKNNEEFSTNMISSKNQRIVNQTKNDQLTVVIGRGNNNEELIREILLERKIWKQVQWGECTPHLKWVFSKQKHNYKKMWSFTQTRAINHFQFNQQISTKDNLIRNLQLYCETKKLQIFTLTPVTFILDFDDEYCEYNVKQFLNFFFKNDPRKMQQSPGRRNGTQFFNFVNKFQPYMSWQNSDIKKRVNILSRPVNSSTYYSENTENPSYIWLLKPTGLNRGRGIQIFDSLEQLQKILMEYLGLFNRRNFKQNSNAQAKMKEKDKMKEKTQNAQQKQKQVQNMQKQLVQEQDEDNKVVKQSFKLKTCSFVIQKYVEKPFLIYNRKFDIRVWALVTQNHNIYFFKEGYIRTSAEAYSTQDIDNYYIHLTNNAIQKNSSNYGNFESGNQLSYNGLAKFIGEEACSNIWERMKEITYMAFSSIKRKIDQNHRKFCFELFGLDYIIDSELKVWLIEINQNPCLQCSSPLLEQLVPRMINDAFKLTIDQIFSDKKPYQKPYPVDGYKDSESLWQSLGQLVPNAEYSPSKNKSKEVSLLSP